MDFTEFKLEPSLIESLASMGFKTPTPIQEQAIPAILDGRDLIACAQTGTGKTAAYLLPVINKMIQKPTEAINTLVIAPTRELAKQIDQQLEGFSYFTPVSSRAIYGGGDGASFEREKRALTEGANIIVSTPGKLIQHLNLGYVKVAELEHLILDEADRMLDMGFFEDIMRIVSHLPKERQTLLFSATMPPKIRTMAKETLKDPIQINIAVSKPAEGVFQAAFLVYDGQKIGLVKHLLKAEEMKSVLMFCGTKKSVKEIHQELRKLGLSVQSIHSDLEQSEREEVLLNFKNRKTRMLVATDILSRGIDIEDIDLVINFDVPHDAEDYVHRVGRTARAASTGVAFTFINQKDQQKFGRIEQLIGKEVSKAKLPEHLGEGPAYQPKKFSRNGKKGFNKKSKYSKRR